MEWLNYHHLLYFHTVGKEGSIARAAQILRLAQPTISGQLKQLEDQLGEQLFERQGRGLVLTDTGNLVFRYADEIFGLGRELQQTLKGRPTGRPWRLRVGIVDQLPKLIGYRLLEPALLLPDPVQLVCTEDKVDVLLAELARHTLDLVIADVPSGPEVSVKAFNHFLGETTVSAFAAPEMAKHYKRGFPQSLGGAPMLLPTTNAVLRSSLESWFTENNIKPNIVAEFEDSALTKVFGQSGRGIFFAPSAIEKEIRGQYNVDLVGRLNDVSERFYAISVERRIKHPAVRAITESARTELFGRAE